jgi:saccharopine dehydrogenase-like NADP-dependent oxidoreductase
MNGYTQGKGMPNVLIAGAGKIGALVAGLLAQSGDYTVTLVDKTFVHSDVQALSHLPHLHCIEGDFETSAFDEWVRDAKIEAVVSCLPYFLNSQLAKRAAALGIHYFDLTEDTTVTETIKSLSHQAKTAFVPQCGIAPGFVNVAANDLMQQFDEIETVKLRVGALPQRVSNALGYALTWSTAGLINQYGNPCQAVVDHQHGVVPPLAGLEQIRIEGENYEAFNTSGGLGSLAELWAAKVKHMTYKTLRYPGHCEKMRFLMDTLKLNQDRDTLQRILEQAIPQTRQDVVIVYIAVSGLSHGEYLERSFMKKIYPDELLGQHWSAIQVATASACCTTIDMFFEATPECGFVYQERFSFTDFLQNRFASCFRTVTA